MKDKLERCEADIESSRKTNELSLLPLNSYTTERYVVILFLNHGYCMSILLLFMDEFLIFDSKLSFVLFKVHFRFGFGFVLFFIISDYGNHSICFQFDGVLTFWDFSNFLKKLIFGDLT